MLNILYGRAGTGKTEQVMCQIRDRAASGETGILLIVPEQYSHDAERRLCEICGDSMSVNAEVLSFTRLCGHVLAETGGAPEVILDKGGQILLLHKALESVAPQLKVFGVRKTRTNLLENLLASVTEFRSLCLSAQDFEELSLKTEKPLSDKLMDFALILGAYEAMPEVYGADLVMRLELLASKIALSPSIGKGHIFFDGFNDFTALEMKVIKQLLNKGADITVCLTCEIDEDLTGAGYDEVFELPRRTIAQLKHLQPDCVLTKADLQEQNDTDTRNGRVCAGLVHLERYLFDDKTEVFDYTQHNIQAATFPLQISNAITIYAAGSAHDECMYAAAVIWDMVRNHGCRWRDIGVMARDFTQYETMCEQVFNKYGIPYFSGGKADIMNKPPAALIDAALEIAVSGFEYKSIFRYLKTGLLQLSIDELSKLENYVLMWNIRSYQWQREWKMPPSGYRTGQVTQRDKAYDGQTLKELNKLRESIVTPLAELRDGIKGETTVTEKLRALYGFMIRISLPTVLDEKSRQYKQNGQLRLGDEYSQLHNIIIDALDNMYKIAGHSIVNAAEFKKLITLVISQNDVGVIPVSLDRVAAGSMAMSRKRDLRCLIILGASDENIPSLSQSGGALSDNERKILSEIDGSIKTGFEERLTREMNMLYNVFTLPSEYLIAIYDKSGNTKPSTLLTKLQNMYNIPIMTLESPQYMCAAEKPYLEYLSLQEPISMTANRGQLTAAGAKLLYGSELTLSASRIDGYYSCPYRYFLQSGLRLLPNRPALFDAASAGSYMHSVLDGVLQEITNDSGFDNVSEQQVKQLVTKYSDKFISDVLLNFEGRNERFIYLFRRYEQSVFYVVSDIIEELRVSEFKPAAFEMDISDISENQRGFIDRVDIYKTGNKQYLRIIDYKTRKSAYKFCLSDVLHGRDMQMLIYLNALIGHYGKTDMIPAGVLYVPARDMIIPATRNVSDSELQKLRGKQMQRSGLVLDKPEIIEAMESGAEKRFLPVRISKDGTCSGDSIVSSYRFSKLSAHVERKITEAEEKILDGDTKCRPYYKNSNDNACIYCEYTAVCRFDRELGDKHNYIRMAGISDVWEALEA